MTVTSPAISVFVPGRPAPQGSKRHVGNGVMVESSKAVKPWRQDIREALLEDGQPAVRIDGAVDVQLEFVLPRPVSTPKRRTPPALRRPDLDKLVRAVLDAVVSAGVIEDDARVVWIKSSKRLAELDEPTGLHLTIKPAVASRTRLALHTVHARQEYL